MSKEITKIVLTGSMRSGTTFLTNYLDSNEKCRFMRDSFLALFRTSSQLGVKTFIEVLPIRLRNIILADLKSEMIRFGISELNSLNSEQFKTLEELFDLAMKSFIADTTMVFGVKVTEAENWLDALLKETNIKVIYMIRDLRDILLSSANIFTNYNRARFSRKWFRCVTRALKSNDSKMIIVKFEDLMLTPNKELERLSAFLGIKFDVSFNSLKDVTGTIWIDNSAFHDVKRIFDPISTYRWKKNLNSKEVEYGSSLYKKLMKELGYEENKLPFFKELKIRIKHNLFSFGLWGKGMRFIKKVFRRP